MVATLLLAMLLLMGWSMLAINPRTDD